MKLSKEEMKNKIDTLDVSDEIKIELLEDIEDSFDIVEDGSSEELEEIKTKYEELKTKYKERFLTSDKKDDKEDDTEELEEEEIVDVKEI